MLPQIDNLIRVRPAELARMLGVSRQAVSEWVRLGKVKIGSDGRMDPREAVRDVLRHSDPGRLRARLLRSLTDDADDLRQQLQEVRHERDALRSHLQELTKERDEWCEVALEYERRTGITLEIDPETGNIREAAPGAEHER